MKQLSQSYSSGELQRLDVPVAANVSPGSLLVGTAASLVSLGTEVAMSDIAQEGLLGKALGQPAQAGLASPAGDAPFH